MNNIGTVYIEHLERPYHHAGHYIGWCAGDVQTRHAQHVAGQGARLLEVVADAGIGFSITRTWVGDRKFERQLKNQKNAKRLCPACNPNAMRRASNQEATQ